ncbi:hypothetical protein IAD21_05084 [Abditibacteriota bacterium]|nr:hypothetical protein IAD21_05084 [Abditibacteriota bacterium]
MEMSGLIFAAVRAFLALAIVLVTLSKLLFVLGIVASEVRWGEQHKNLRSREPATDEVSISPWSSLQ